MVKTKFNKHSFPTFPDRKIATAILIAGTLMVSACATRERVVVRETVVVQPARIKHMPALVHEDRGNWPGQGWEWVPGHWKWEGSEWFWVHGKWVQQHIEPMPPVIVEQITVAPSTHHYWVPGHWFWRFDGHGGWVWVKGSWRM